MKRFTAIITALIITVITASGCSGANTGAQGEIIAPATATPQRKPSIVCTAFPQYDWVRQILGDSDGQFDLVFLSNGRADMHSYQPSAEDMIKIISSDLFIHVGGKSDAWVDSALRQAGNPGMTVISLVDALCDYSASKEAVTVADHSHNHGGGHIDDEHDEHVWLSLRNAQLFCRIIADALAQIDEDGAAGYHSNADAYIARLGKLDDEYRSALRQAPLKTVVFADRFPFRCLMDDYGLNYYAAFPGCSGDAQVSFSTITFLAAKVDELGLCGVMVTENADESIAKAILSNTKENNRRILVLNSLQSVSEKDTLGAASYISIMENNLSILKEALCLEPAA